MPSLNNNDEQKLVDGVRQAVRYVDDDNMSPNDALVKVSRDLSLLPGQARAAVNAFNNGRQVAQWKANTPVLDKLAEFELADYDAIHDTVWGGDEKKANDYYLSSGTTVHEDYSSGPKWVDMRNKQKLAALNIPLRTDIVKEASDHVDEHEFRHDSDRRASSAWSTFSMARRTYEDQRSKHAAAKDNLGIRLNILSNYFKKFAQDRLPFDVVDKTVATYYGSQGRALMEVVAEQFPKEKRAADSKRYWEAPIEMNAEPFTFVSSAVEAAKELNFTKSALDMSKDALNNAEEALRPFSRTPNPSSQETTEFSPFLIDNGRGHAKLAGLLTRKLDDPQILSAQTREGEMDFAVEHTVPRLLAKPFMSQKKAIRRALEQLAAINPDIVDRKGPLTSDDLVQLGTTMALGQPGRFGFTPEAIAEMEEDEKKASQDDSESSQPAGQMPRHDCHAVHPDMTHEEWLKSSEKEAAGLLTGALIGGGAKPAMEALIGGEGRRRKVEETEDQLAAPQHENELRKIRAQVMLTEMMSDSENPISGHDPEEVLAAYNDLARLAPRLAEQPAAMQPLLAKRLAGNVEPFEVKEIGEMEKSLASTQAERPDITKSNDSIL